MDMSSESSAARWYEPPRTSLEPPSAAAAGVAGVVGNPTDYRGYYPHAGPTAHHPAAAAAHYAHSEYRPSSVFLSGKKIESDFFEAREEEVEEEKEDEDEEEEKVSWLDKKR
ncbi:hypothetical protein HZH68_012018 [Vespula germanica]|uniref:Uncharacterized protein n=1 Tax=Vespula germanica TaxID=30212 RepID=A0A834JME1_VESGE|nr:hypothetical protein HZH68_012018 [Vespula germanica]